MTFDMNRSRDAMLRLLSSEVHDPRVLTAFERVPRERFVPPDLAPYSYEDRPLPIGFGQTISQPLMVAIMTNALGLNGNEKVLEVGTGSGYQAAILAELAQEVHTIERVPELAQRAHAVLESLAYENVRVHVARKGLGWPPDAPYDAVIVTAGAPRVPQSLIDQMAIGARMAIPVGNRRLQELIVVTKKSDQDLAYERHGECRFVPLIAEEEAWSDEPP